MGAHLTLCIWVIWLLLMVPIALWNLGKSCSSPPGVLRTSLKRSRLLNCVIRWSLLRPSHTPIAQSLGLRSIGRGLTTPGHLDLPCRPTPFRYGTILHSWCGLTTGSSHLEGPGWDTGVVSIGGGSQAWP